MHSRGRSRRGGLDRGHCRNHREKSESFRGHRPPFEGLGGTYPQPPGSAPLLYLFSKFYSVVHLYYICLFILYSVVYFFCICLVILYCVIQLISNFILCCLDVLYLFGKFTLCHLFVMYLFSNVILCGPFVLYLCTNFILCCLFVLYVFSNVMLCHPFVLYVLYVMHCLIISCLDGQEGLLLWPMAPDSGISKHLPLIMLLSNIHQLAFLSRLNCKVAMCIISRTASRSLHRNQL